MPRYAVLNVSEEKCSEELAIPGKNLCFDQVRSSLFRYSTMNLVIFTSVLEFPIDLCTVTQDICKYLQSSIVEMRFMKCQDLNLALGLYLLYFTVKTTIFSIQFYIAITVQLKNFKSVCHCLYSKIKGILFPQNT